jgi:hypothetical protein
MRVAAAHVMIEHAQQIKVENLETKPWYQELQQTISELKPRPSSPVSLKMGRLTLSGRDVPLKQQERRNGPGSITNG